MLLDDGTLFAVASDGPGGDVLAQKSGADLIVTVNLLLTERQPDQRHRDAEYPTERRHRHDDAAGHCRIGDAGRSARRGTDDERITTPEGVRAHGDQRYVRKSGDTMTGNLLTVTPALTDDSPQGCQFGVGAELRRCALPAGGVWIRGSTWRR